MYKGAFVFKPITFSDVSIQINYKKNEDDKEVITDVYTPNDKVGFYLDLLELAKEKTRIIQIEHIDYSKVHHKPVAQFGCGITNLQARINAEMRYQLNKNLNIQHLDPVELNVSFDDKLKVDIFMVSKGPGYAHHTYNVYVRNSLKLEDDWIAMLCDDNLCFGYRINESSKEIPGGLFKIYTVIVHTD